MAKKAKRKGVATQDYTVDMLPKNRKEVFFDVLKLHWKQFVLYGFVFLLFCAPIILISVFESIVNTELYLQLNSATEEQKLQIISQMTTNSNLSVLLQIPSIWLLSICFAGMSKVIRQYAWAENVFFNAHFYGGIKENGKQFFVLSAFASVLYAISAYCFNLSKLTTNNFLAVCLILPLGLFLLVGAPIIAYATASIPIYKIKFPKLLTVSFALSAKAPFKTILALICCLGLLALQLINNLIVLIVVKVVYSLLAPIILLAWFLFALNQQDKLINSKNYPHLVGKGTASEILREQNQLAEATTQQ